MLDEETADDDEGDSQHEAPSGRLKGRREMKRMWRMWLAFGVCLAVVLAAMGYVSLTALDLDDQRRQADLNAEAEEKIRLALWRMDSALVPLIVQESARPHFVYQPFHRVSPALARIYNPSPQDEILLPSPLLTFESDQILLHFHLDADDKLSSPRAPTGNYLDLATDGYLTGEQADEAARRLARLRPLLDPQRLLAVLPAPEPAALDAASQPAVAEAQQLQQRLATQQEQAADNLNQLGMMRSRKGVTRREAVRLLSDASVVARSFTGQQARFAQSATFHPALLPSATRQGALTPCWVGGELLLARRVQTGAAEAIQGCWLNWAVIRRSLLEGAADLVPDGELLPAGPGGSAHALAMLPVRLEAGRVPQDAPPPASPVPMSLAVAWACVLIGAAAVAVLLGKAVSLSQRRGAFVSAVTHELRTPLTTFRLYADMLADGLIADETKRADYLRRLRDEADRLSHLVENVLSYARLSGPRSAASLESVRVGRIVDRSRERLAALADRARMQLVVEADEAALETTVRCNASAVEQILLNLVDNACKYAGRAEDRRIHLAASVVGGRAELRVCDHGPGVSADESNRLFRPFRKSARQAAHSAPGIGLGLSLSRRLARAMGGELRCEPDPSGGACFALSLPAIRSG